MHFNIEIAIQEVQPKQLLRDGAGRAIMKTGQEPVYQERIVKETFRVALTADTQEEAYRRAIALLEVNRPQHLHRVSCDDASGNKTCGYPADGPTIVSS